MATIDFPELRFHLEYNDDEACWTYSKLASQFWGLNPEFNNSRIQLLFPFVGLTAICAGSVYASVAFVKKAIDEPITGLLLFAGIYTMLFAASVSILLLLLTRGVLSPRTSTISKQPDGSIEYSQPALLFGFRKRAITDPVAIQITRRTFGQYYPGFVLYLKTPRRRFRLLTLIDRTDQDHAMQIAHAIASSMGLEATEN